MIRHLGVLAFVSILAGSAAALDISTCGVTVPVAESGVLQTDLSCTGAFVVALERGATLDLNGHTITLAITSNGSRAAVQCQARRCTVGGPGTIQCSGGPSEYASGIGMSQGGRLEVANVVISSCDQGIWDMGTPQAKTRVLATNVTVLSSTYNGIEAEKLAGTNVEASDNGFSGLAVEQVKATNIVVSGNGTPSHPSSGIGSFAGTVKITGLTATDNRLHGVDAKRAILFDSTVTGNDGVDISSTRFPRLVNVVCGTSNWGVCQND